jgi:hypothetical protein
VQRAGRVGEGVSSTFWLITYSICLVGGAIKLCYIACRSLIITCIATADWRRRRVTRRLGWRFFLHSIPGSAFCCILLLHVWRACTVHLCLQIYLWSWCLLPRIAVWRFCSARWVTKDTHGGLVGLACMSMTRCPHQWPLLIRQHVQDLRASTFANSDCPRENVRHVLATCFLSQGCSWYTAVGIDQVTCRAFHCCQHHNHVWYTDRTSNQHHLEIALTGQVASSFTQYPTLAMQR